MTKTRLTLGLAAMVCLVLTACAGAQTHFYTLDATTTGRSSAIDYVGVPLRIDAVHIPPALDRPELVRETSQNHFTVSDDNHWAAPLGELLRRVLTQDLSAKLPRGKIIFPDTPKPSGSGGLVIDILAITPSNEGVVMDVSWTLLLPSPEPDQASHPLTFQQNVRLQTPSVGAGVAGNAAELSALADKLAEAISEGLVLQTSRSDKSVQ